MILVFISTWKCAFAAISERTTCLAWHVLKTCLWTMSQSEGLEWSLLAFWQHLTHFSTDTCSSWKVKSGKRSSDGICLLSVIGWGVFKSVTSAITAGRFQYFCQLKQNCLLLNWSEVFFKLTAYWLSDLDTCVVLDSAIVCLTLVKTSWVQKMTSVRSFSSVLLWFLMLQTGNSLKYYRWPVLFNIG